MRRRHSAEDNSSNKFVRFGFSLLLAVSSCYRGGRRRGVEELGWWRHVLLLSLLLELVFYGSACWFSPATRPAALIGACLPPMCHVAGLQDPGVYARWKMRRLQRGFLLYRSVPANQLLFFVVFFSGDPSVRTRAVAEGSMMQRRSTVGLGSSCFFSIVRGLFCKLGTAAPYLDVSCTFDFQII